MRRDDFLKPTKDTLCRRVNGKCSLCGVSTSGPLSDPTKASTIGCACHISAAVADGPRYDPTLTPKQRRSIQNGIWLCSNCHNRVDNDPSRYTVDELQKSKRDAERRADEELGRHPNILLRRTLVLTVSAIGIIILGVLIVDIVPRPRPAEWRIAIPTFNGPDQMGSQAATTAELNRLLSQKLHSMVSNPRLAPVCTDCETLPSVHLELEPPDFYLKGYVRAGEPMSLSAALFDQDQTLIASVGPTRSPDLREALQEIAGKVVESLQPHGLRVDDSEVDRIRSIPASSGEALRSNNIGLELMRAGDLSGARAAFRRALALDQRFAAAHSNLASLEVIEGNPETAEAEYRRALELIPEYPPFLFNLGHFYLHNDRSLAPADRIESALELLGKAVEVDPSYWQAFNEIGNGYLEMGQPNEAVEALEAAHRLVPTEPVVLKNLGRASLGRGDPATAVKYLRQAAEWIAQSDQNRFRTTEILVHLALAYEALEQVAPACRSLERATELDPSGITPLAKHTESGIARLRSRCMEVNGSHD